MRLKLRLLFLSVIFFILFISFKIMEPELDDMMAEFPDGESRAVDRRVQMFVSAYDLDWEMGVPSDGPWAIAASWVDSRSVHPDSTPQMGAILKALSTAKIVKATVGYRGTQLKMSLVLEGGQKAAFKPKWFERDHVIRGRPYDGADRHNGEIASFHLNRLLGLRRAPLVAGRVIDMETEIRPVADQKLLQTFFKNGSDTCFYGRCYYCKGPETGVCGRGTQLEGVVSLWLPHTWRLHTLRSPWGRTYREGVTAQWESDDAFCQKVRRSPPFNSGPRLLDFMDAAVFDYLAGNADAHHYETLGNRTESVVLLIDRGKTFGNPYEDELSILTPLSQCCLLRRQTYDRLTLLTDGVLSRVLHQLLSHDPIAPVLTEPHYTALDRRLGHVLGLVADCVGQRGEDRVLVTDIGS